MSQIEQYLNKDVLLLVFLVAALTLPLCALAVSFVYKCRRYKGVGAAIAELERQYPFPPRHRAIYQSLQSMTADTLETQNSLEELIAKLSTWENDEELGTEEIIELVRTEIREIEGNLGVAGNVIALKDRQLQKSQ